MKRVCAAIVAPTMISALLAAGCGSSSSSSSSASASANSSTPATSSSAASSTSSIVVTTKHDKLGTILAAGPKRLTVYLFAADKASGSSCTGKCASAWPPVTGKPTASGQAAAADLGTITRPDGTTQVTYKGHPLYYFIKDKDNGDAYGQGVTAFGASWYALAPTGARIEKSGSSGPASGGAAPAPATTSTGGGGSYG